MDANRTINASETISLEPQIVRVGLQHATARSQASVLCIARPHTISFVGVSGRRLLVSWEHPLPEASQHIGRAVQYYLFPPLIVHLMASSAAQSITRMRLGMAGKDVCLTMTDANGSYELRWRADPNAFLAPPEFAKMLVMPEGLIEVSYLHISDAAHQAVANLMVLHSNQNVPPDKLAILVDFSPSKLVLNGQTVANRPRGRHYFDPRLIIRALEFIKARHVRVGLNVVSGSDRAILTMLAEQSGWHVHCSLLSIGTDTQKLYPPNIE